MNTSTALIGLDWGTTSLRAYRFAADGSVTGRVASSDGILALRNGAETRFESGLRAVGGDWLAAAPDAPLLAAGMIGSRQGWAEAPYVPTPADLAGLTSRLTTIPRDGADLRIVPGVVDAGPLPSVMRGEETQLVGVLSKAAWADDDDATSLVVLPGTHTKWVRLRGRTVTSIATTMTGEVYSLLRRDSILASTMTDDPATAGEGVESDAGIDARDDGGTLVDRGDGRDAELDDAFVTAVRLARDSGVGATSTIFSTRSLGLLDRLAPRAQASHLSGLLIGHELTDHGRERAPGGWTLAGSSALCRRYALAARELGWPAPHIAPEAAPTGLWRLAVAAGLAADVTTPNCATSPDPITAPHTTGEGATA